MNLIKHLLLSVLVLTSLSGFCRQLTPEEALARVSSRLIPTRGLSAPKLLKSISPTGKPDFKSVYLYDCEPGYMVVSADDVAKPLLGYSDKPIGNAGEIPPGMKYWLEFYAEEIGYAAENPVEIDDSPVNSEKHEIGPLLTCQWNQDSPYNNLCPVYLGMKSVTGCVATAMAQVMYYHKWPEVCQGGTVNYTSNMGGFYKKELSLDFDSVRFDWSNMLDSYNNDATQENINAVAELMMTVGYSVRMMYSPLVSASYSFYIGEGLNYYFNYSDYIQTHLREYFTTQGWEDVVYNQLAHGLPVLYGGTTSKDEGHQFVCDGYRKDGYFHINWGWGGMSDGYFQLSALRPANQGIGGASSGFNYDQEVTINVVRPGNEPEGASKYLLCNVSDFTTRSLGNNPTESSLEYVSLGNNISFFPRSDNGILNLGCKTVSGYFGIQFEDEDGNITTSFFANHIDIGPFFNVYGLSVKIPELEDGIYKMTPVFQVDDEDDLIVLRGPVSKVQTLTLNVNDGRGIMTIGEISEEGLGVTNVNSLIQDDLVPEYYNLMGQKVRNPRKGELIIEKKGNRSKKIIY